MIFSWTIAPIVLLRYFLWAVFLRWPSGCAERLGSGCVSISRDTLLLIFVYLALSVPVNSFFYAFGVGKAVRYFAGVQILAFMVIFDLWVVGALVIRHASV